jgi:hypothetical protein
MSKLTSQEPLIFSWPKVCLCQRSHSQENWLRLPFAYTQSGCFDDEGKDRFGPDLEGRHCPCGSTICVPVDAVQIKKEG